MGSIEVLGWSTAVLHFFGCSRGLTGYLRDQIGGKRGFLGVVREVCRFFRVLLGFIDDLFTYAFLGSVV